MEIPQYVQDKLKCSECDELLSCGPVYLLHETGGTICGRCSQNQQPQEKDSNSTNNRTRNEPYEATASLLAFPCGFAARGCPEKVKFSLGEPPHELNCEFRPFICPISPRGSCDWFGSWTKLKEHCDEKHEANVFENKCIPPRPNLTTSNLQMYLISAFNFLFLLHIKVCVTSGKLFHSVRMFGNSKFVDKFSYSLKIEGNDKKITEYGSVLPSGILMLQEPTAICTTINSLLDFLGGKYNESKFTITLQTLINFNCLNCLKKYEVSDSKFCEKCKKKLIKCKYYEKCLFVDVNSDKAKKHERYYCEYQTKCCLCGVNLVGSFAKHLDSSTYCRERIKSNIDSVVRLQPNTNSNYIDILFSSNNIGTIICSYILSDSKLILFLFTSLLSYELKNYKCTIELTDPLTKHNLLLTPGIKNNNWNDWSINEDVNNFPSWKNIGIDMKIKLYKNVI